MTGTLDLTLGGLVVRHGKVLKVFKINKATVDLQPFYNFQTSNGLTFTLQLKNAHRSCIRPLVSKKKLNRLLNLTFNRATTKVIPIAIKSKTALINNRLEETLQVIKILWREKQEKSKTLSGGKLAILKKAMIQAAEEIAAVNHTSPKQAEKLILSNLKSKPKTNPKKKTNNI